MTDETLRQQIADEDHLKLLSIGYIVSAALSAIWSLFALMYVFFILLMFMASSSASPAGRASKDPSAMIFFWVFAAFGSVMILRAIGMAVAKFWTAMCIRRRKSHTFCMVIAALARMDFPFGTLLSAFTFIVLARESVMRLFTPAPAQS